MSARLDEAVAAWGALSADARGDALTDIAETIATYDEIAACMDDPAVAKPIARDVLLARATTLRAAVELLGAAGESDKT